MHKLNNTLFCGLLLVVTIILLYSKTFKYDWHFDDYRIVDNAALHMTQLSKDSLKNSWYSDQQRPERLYRPVTNFTFALNYYFHGLDVRGYRLTNIVIHCCAAIFLFLFLQLSLVHFGHSSFIRRNSRIIAFLTALLWAIHPINIQAVTYVVQRMASLAGMFYIAALFWYLKTRMALPGYRRIGYGLFFICCGILAVGSKENALMLPIAILLCEYLFFRSEKFSRFFSKRNAVLVVLALLAAGFCVVINETYFQDLLGGYEGRPFSPSQRVLTELRVIIFYLFQLFNPIPSNFSIDHQFEISVGLFQPHSTFLALVLLIAVIFACLRSASKYPIYSFCIVFFFVNHVIESSIIPLEIVFEHRNYIPSMLLFLPFISIIIEWRSISVQNKNLVLTNVITVAISMIFMGTFVSSYIANRKWENGYTLWTDALMKNPEMMRPRINLADWYIDQGKLQEAKENLLIAVKLDPYHYTFEKCDAFNNLGVVFQRLGEIQSAEQSYKNCLSINQDNLSAISGLISIYSMQGRIDQAEALLKKIKNLAINDETILFNLGLYYLRQGKSKLALSYFQIIRSDKLILQSKQYTGIAYMQMHQYEKAVKIFSQIAHNNKRNIRNNLHLAEALLRIGKDKEAQEIIDQSTAFLVSSEELSKVLMWINDSSDHQLKPDKALLLPLIIDDSKK